MQARKVLGPYEVLDVINRDEPVAVVDFPFSLVQGGNLTCVVNENLSNAQAGTFFSLMAMFEVEIQGIVQGQVDVLKRGWINGFSGPMKKTFEDWDAYETIVVRCRNMVGGKPGGNIINNDPANFPSLSTQLGFFARLTVNVQPRGAYTIKPEPKKEQVY